MASSLTPSRSLTVLPVPGIHLIAGVGTGKAFPILYRERAWGRHLISGSCSTVRVWNELCVAHLETRKQINRHVNRRASSHVPHFRFSYSTATVILPAVIASKVAFKTLVLLFRLSKAVANPATVAENAYPEPRRSVTVNQFPADSAPRPSSASNSRMTCDCCLTNCRTVTPEIMRLVFRRYPITSSLCA